MSGTNNACQVPPFMNTDIGGIGVRISFYLQIIFLAMLSARSETLDETTGALSTLIATNMATAVTALILGLKHEPELTFQDGLVVFYLLAMSWVTVFLCLPFLRYPAGTGSLKLLSVLQSYLILTFALVILITAETFGNRAECNSRAVVVLFLPFSALKAGRIIGWIVVTAVATMYTIVTVIDYLPPQRKKFEEWVTRRRIKEKRQEPTTTTPGPEHLGMNETLRETTFVSPLVSQSVPTYDLKISGDLVVKLIVILISWSIAVTNIELLITRNQLKQDPSAQSPWQFGQVLPMFLLVQPFLNLVTTFTKYKLSPRRNVW